MYNITFHTINFTWITTDNMMTDNDRFVWLSQQPFFQFSSAVASHILYEKIQIAHYRNVLYSLYGGR